MKVERTSKAVASAATTRPTKRCRRPGSRLSAPRTAACPPESLKATPTVAEIAHDYAGKLKVMKLNVDEAMNSAGRYRVQGIPTLLLFKNGQVVEQIVGAVPKDQITKALERHIA